MYPKAFSTDIPVTNKDFYNIIGASKTSGSGLLDVGISAKVFTLDVLEWESKKEDEKKASYFGFESIMVLHDPTYKPKKTASKKTDTAETGENTEEK